MSIMTYRAGNGARRQALGLAARRGEDATVLGGSAHQAGMLLRRLQRGERLSMPASRPMPIIGRRCHELRIRDADQTWRIIYRVDSDAVIIADVFSKKTATTPTTVIEVARTRLRNYDDAVKG